MGKFERDGFRSTFMFQEIMEEPETIINTVNSVSSDISKTVNLIKIVRSHMLREAEQATMLQWSLKKLAGRFLIVTNTDLKGDEVVSAYKEQWQIERSFRTIKSFLDIGPVNHRKEERIEAHVFVCVLSLLIARLFEKSMNEEMTISDMLSELKAIPIKTADGIITLRSESDNARNILEKMKIPYPGKILSSVPT
ncbi:MAG: IS1634 family transposase [Thermoplasmataceae archaeon]